MPLKTAPALGAIVLTTLLTGCQAGDAKPEPTAPADDAAQRSAVECTQEFVDATFGDFEPSETPETDPVVTRLEVTEFEPQALGAVLKGGCAVAIEFVSDAATTLYSEAYVPGGKAVLEELTTALVDDGFRWVTDNQYIGIDGRTVFFDVNDLSHFSEEQLAGDGVDFLGDEFIVVSTYLEVPKAD